MIAICALGTGVRGQNLSKQFSPTSCPLAAEISPLHLYGLWRAEFAGLPQGATLLFEKHPELAGSVSGGINRDGVKAQIAGDVDQGEFTLEESFDGQHIAATWLGTVVENACGKEIRGTWNHASTNASYPFVLRKLPGWQ
jgi:hypothetical protein